MKKETLKNIFDFLEEEDNKNKPFRWKLVNNEPLMEDELTIEGDLHLGSLSIKSLPDNLVVKGELYLSDSSIESLPKGLVVGGDLSLRRCMNLKSLSKGLKVDGDLYISRSSMEHYSDDEIREMIKPGYINGEIF
jgi:Leucine-rich repeat (LRR) protein